MTTATSRFIALIGEDRLHRGAGMSERGIGTGRTYGSFLDGKETFITNALYSDATFCNPYLYDSTAYWAFKSGAGIELADLRDIVRIMS